MSCDVFLYRNLCPSSRFSRKIWADMTCQVVLAFLPTALYLIIRNLMSVKSSSEAQLGEPSERLESTMTIKCLKVRFGLPRIEEMMRTVIMGFSHLLHVLISL